MIERCEKCGMYWGDPHNCYPPEDMHWLHSTYLDACLHCRRNQFKARLIDVA